MVGSRFETEGTRPSVSFHADYMWDKMYNEVYKNSKVRKFYNQIYDWAKSLPENVIVKKKNEAENLFKKIGITFSVYNNFDSTERLIPFDMFPRIISSTEWKKIKRGVIQRALAVNAFLNDIYNSGEIIKAKLIPENLIYKNPAYEIKMIGFKVPKKIYSPINNPYPPEPWTSLTTNLFKLLRTYFFASSSQHRQVFTFSSIGSSPK